ncbi:hypothetical protein [Actinocorallia populi]|uniref:hypothetical protein n=1 Tax=Actinocorallia populi TaxID=2079200 RepID=UPI000D08EC0F|nr:hypothetical protein [Actinocorallia populi]
MKTLRTFTVTAAAGVTVLALASPASALYAGNIQASLLGTATVTTSLGGGSCTSSTLNGALASGGGLSVSSAGFSSCSGATVTAQNLPWTGGNVTASTAVPGGRDGTATIAGFRVRAVVTILGANVTCVYGGNLTANAYNGTNAARPVPGNGQFQISLNNVSAAKQSGSNFLCPGTASVVATYEVKGESVPGSGVYNQSISLP